MHTELDLSTHAGFGEIIEMLVGSDLESTSAWNNAFIIDGVLDGSESVSDGFLGLSDGVIVWTLDQDGAGEWIGDTFDESEFVLSQNLLINVVSESEIFLRKIVNGVDLVSSAG